MKNTSLLFATTALVATMAASGALAATPTAADTAQTATTVTDIVVTAERRSEKLQETPVAVSALSGKDLSVQRIDTGGNLASTVPNMSFQPGLFGKPNFSIRGIGYQLVTTTGDAGVAVHENDGPIASGRIAQAEFFDVDQVEVLRGPQGTLYGRNATGGVINVITAKPGKTFSGSATIEGGNYDHIKAAGYVNVPLGDMFGLRLAGVYSKHSGYVLNVFDGQHINDQNVYSTRATVSFEPNDKFRAYAMWEHFSQDDSGGGNAGVGANVCTPDPGPTSVGGVAVTSAAVRNLMSFGCSLNVNIYAPGAVGGTLNGVGTFGNRLGFLFGFAPGSLFVGEPTLTSPYQTNNDQDAFNHTRNDLAQISAEWDVTPTLKVSSLTTYDRDSSAYGAGGLRSTVSLPFTIADPQIAGGAALNKYTSAGYVTLWTEEYSEELRLQSSFDGPLNFSIGGIYLHAHKYDDVFVFDNINSFIGTNSLGEALDKNDEFHAFGGHEYFQSLNPYNLTSMAAFGEVYWQFTPELKLTGGVRVTRDHKVFNANSSASNLLSPSPPNPTSGFTFGPPQSVTFTEPTGRVNLDWTPKLSFTDSTLVYLSVARGYKGGGFNPPNLPASVPASYKPEFIDAYEIGTKNVLLEHTLTIDLTGFYYNYQGYQFTQAAVFGTITNNVNARIWGLEFESVWNPVENLALNAQVGYLNTKILGGPTATSIDQFDPTNGNPNETAVKTLTNFCIANTASLAHLISDIQNGVNTTPGGGAAPTAAGAFGLTGFCAAAGTTPAAGTLAASYNIFAGVNSQVQAVGEQKSFAGNRLPNVPDWTAAVGAQYAIHINDDWTLTPRVDVRYTGGEFSDLFNTPGLFVKAHASASATLTLADAPQGFIVQGFAKNIGSQGTIVGAAPGGGAITGSENTAIISDPTTYGVSITKRF